MPADSRSIAPLYFLSDVHLGVGSADAERRKLDRLLALLEYIRNDAAALYIVGDLFDFWYEYTSVVPRGYHRLYAQLELLVSSGVSVTYLAGNHDFAIGDFFSRDLGIRVERDHVGFAYAGKRFHVFHGDGLAARDAGYRMIKRVLRSPISQRLFRLLHPDLGFGIARRFSHSSRDYTATKQFGETDGMRLEAERRIHEGSDYVIMGHRHIPIREELDGGVYVNLGDWIRYFTYAVFRDGDIALHTMINGTQELYQA